MEVTREFTKPGWRLRLFVRVDHGAWLTLIDERDPKRVRIVRSWTYPWHEVQQGISDAELWANLGEMTEEVKAQVREEGAEGESLSA